MTMKAILIGTGFVLSLAACGGGEGSPPSQAPTQTAVPVSTPPPSPPAPPPPPPSSLTFTPGVFEAASEFEDQCEVVRTGVDIEGNAFPDMPGSLLAEKFWLRSWTNETYLFADEVTDRDPNNFDTPVAYFDVLRTTALTPSGEDRDDFHFSEPTEDFLARRTSAANASYGARFIGINSAPPRDFRVLYTDSNTPSSQSVAGQPAFVRGTRILEVDGVDLVNSSNVDALNAGLFPASAGEIHTFRVQDPGSTEARDVTLTAQNLSPDPVNRIRILNTPSGEVGYLLFNTFSPFSSEEALVDAFSDLSAVGVDDLVLDLRYNGGGLLAVASQLSFMIAGNTQTFGRTFELLQFNGKSGNRNPVTGELNEPIPFFNETLGFSVSAGTPLDSLDLPRVFILSTEGTCSASEAVINGLRGIGVDVILIGDTTCGKPFGFYPTDNCGRTYYTIQFQGVNDQGFGGYTDGFVPEDSTFAFGVRLSGCVVQDDLTRELGDPAEALLSAALEYRETATCPASPPASSIARANAMPPPAGTFALSDSSALALDDGHGDEIGRSLANNRDMRMPGK